MCFFGKVFILLSGLGLVLHPITWIASMSSLMSFNIFLFGNFFCLCCWCLILQFYLSWLFFRATKKKMGEGEKFQLGTAGALGLSVVSSVSIVICNKALMSTLHFIFGKFIERF